MKEMEDIFRNKENRLDSLDKNNMQTDLWEEKRRFIEQVECVNLSIEYSVLIFKPKLFNYYRRRLYHIITVYAAN